MINLGLDPTQVAQFNDLIKTSHKVGVTVQMLTTAGDYVTDASASLISGSVDMDASADITRSCKLTLLDPINALGLDYRNSGEGVNYYNRMFRVLYTISSLVDPKIAFTYPLFTGPVTDVDRDGPILNIDCQGKEVMATEGIMHDWSWPVGWPKAQVMLNYLYDYVGETWNAHDDARSDIVLSEVWAVEAGENLWPRFKEMARSMGLMLYYDAWGIARLKYIPNWAQFEFNESNMTSRANVTFDIDNMCNLVRVAGGTAEGLEGRYVAIAQANPAHPMSAENLARRPGVPRYISEFISDDSLTTQQQVQDMANQALYERLVQSLDVSFTSVVVPQLEESDMIAVSSSQFWGWVRLSKMSIPLVGDGEMSVGFISTSVAGLNARDGASVRTVDVPVPGKEMREKAGKGKEAEQRLRDKDRAAAKEKGRSGDKDKPKKVNGDSKKKPKKGVRRGGRV